MQLSPPENEVLISFCSEEEQEKESDSVFEISLKGKTLKKISHLDCISGCAFN